MYSVTGYFNTGYNVINIPMSPSVLEEVATTKEFDSVDLLQDDGLSYVDVCCEWNEISNVDYMKIGSIYYAVPSSPVMTSKNVARVPLLADYLTTAGGIGAMNFTDGMIERAVFPSDSDVWGTFAETDPYLAPAMPMQMEVGQFVGANSIGTTNVIESTIDLTALAAQFEGSGSTVTFNGSGITFTDPASKETVTIPYTEGVKNFSQYIVGNRTVLSPGTKLYMSNNTNIKKALGALRAIGAESAIISQTAYPTDLITVTATDNGEVASVSANDISEADTGLSFVYDSSIPNCLNYSGYCKFGIMTASGSKMEAAPLQIAQATGAGNAKVTIKSDPKPTGKPYFRFSGLAGDNTTEGFWLGAVDGMQWASVPLVWTEPSGSYQSQVNFDISAEQSNRENRYLTTNAGISAASGIVGAMQQAVTGYSQVGAIGAVVGGVKGAIDVAQTVYAENYRENQYALARQKELLNFQISQTVVTPSIQCPFNASMIRDFYGNGAFTYRYKYHPWDQARLTQIIKRFGNKKTMKLTSSQIMIGDNGFGYLVAHGVQVSNSIPRRWKDGIAEQLDNGVRYWDRKPTAT